MKTDTFFKREYIWYSFALCAGRRLAEGEWGSQREYGLRARDGEGGLIYICLMMKDKMINLSCWGGVGDDVGEDAGDPLGWLWGSRGMGGRWGENLDGNLNSEWYPLSCVSTKSESVFWQLFLMASVIQAALVPGLSVGNLKSACCSWWAAVRPWLCWHQGSFSWS